ncbi:hypothetical protein C8R43DRAFT_1156304 [Mycena crocata]|nr:hypothetical protein C8R43DRAFT_1156304 [Mycena crocata]
MDDGTIDLADQTILLNYLHLLGISILYWDHLITLDNEIKYIWIRKKWASSIWFFLIRYLGFAGNIPVVLFSFMTLAPVSNTISGVRFHHFFSALEMITHRRCLRYSFIHQIILVLTHVAVCVVMILRTYALYERNNRLIVCLLALGVGLIAVSSWTVHGQTAIPVQIFPGCHLGVTQTTGYHLSASWIALFLFDSIIFGLTMFRTHSTRLHLGGGENLPIHMLLVRDGALYFAAMALANLANIITYYLTGPLIRGSLSTFANCVSVTMMSRLMLNLHAQAHVGVLSQSNNTGFDNVSLALDFREPEESPPMTRIPLHGPDVPMRAPELDPNPEPGGIAVVSSTDVQNTMHGRDEEY